MTVGLASNQLTPEVTVNQMVDGYFSKSVAGGTNVTLTDIEATWAVIELTGALTGNITVYVPAVSNVFIIYNNTSGSYTLDVDATGGTGVEVPQGYAMYLYCDGTDVKGLSIIPQTITGKVFKSNTLAASSPGSSSGTLILDLSNGHEFNVTLTEAVSTLTISNVPSGNVSRFTLDITQDGAGGWGITWPASIQWDGGVAPTLTTTAGANSVLEFRTKDNGTTWQGRLYADDLQ